MGSFQMIDICSNKMCENVFLLNAKINEYLKDKPDESAEYFKILHDFKTRATNPNQILNQIQHLFENDKEIIENLHNSVDAFSEPIPNIIIATDNFLSLIDENPLKLKLSKVLSLCFEGLISKNALICYLEKTLPDNLDEERKQKILLEAHKFTWSVEKYKSEFYHSISSGHSLLSTLPTEFYVSKIREIPDEIKFFAASGLILQTEEEIDTLLKCLKLYGSQVLPAKSAAQWLKTIDNFIASEFVSIACSSEPFILYPGNIHDISSRYFNIAQMKWAFGELIYSKISNMPPLKFTNPLEAVRSIESNDLEEKDQIIAAPQIADMQCSQFYLYLKNVAKQLKDNRQIQPSQMLLDALYGEDAPVSQSKEKKDKIIGLVISHSFSQGKRIQKIFDKYIEVQEQRNSPSKPFWRSIYKKYMSKTSVIRRLVFSGLNKENQPSDGHLKQAINAIKDITDQIEAVKEVAETVVNIIFYNGKTDVRYCSQATACCIFYIYELARMIEKISSDTSISDLSSIVLKNDPPFLQYGDSILCNADIPIKHIMGCIGTLKSFPKNRIINSDMTEILLNGEPFFFTVKRKNDILILHGQLNPTTILE